MVSDGGPRPQWVALGFGVIPGLGHLVLGRARRGWYFFFGVTLAANVALLSRIVALPPFGAGSFQVAAVTAAAVWLYSLFDLVRLAIVARLPGARARRREVLAAARGQVRRNELAAAREGLDALLDLDPGDSAVRRYLAAVERRSGHPERALRHAKKALAASPGNPEKAALLREIALSKEIRRAP